MVYPLNVTQFSLGAGNGSSQRLLVVSTRTPTSPPTDDRTFREAPVRGQGGQSFSSRAVVTSTSAALTSIGARGPAHHHLHMTFSRLRPRGNRPRGLKRIAATTLDDAGSTPGRRPAPITAKTRYEAPSRSRPRPFEDGRWRRWWSSSPRRGGFLSFDRRLPSRVSELVRGPRSVWLAGSSWFRQRGRPGRRSGWGGW
jgi:hypothetical protein